MPIVFYQISIGEPQSDRGLVWLGRKPPKLPSRVQIPAVAPQFFVKFKGRWIIMYLASDDCYDPYESEMTMIWILS